MKTTYIQFQLPINIIRNITQLRLAGNEEAHLSNKNDDIFNNYELETKKHILYKCPRNQRADCILQWNTLRHRE